MSCRGTIWRLAFAGLGVAVLGLFAPHAAGAATRSGGHVLTPDYVMTRSGPVSGFAVDSWRDRNDNLGGTCHVLAFLGIPYAAPPTGSRRWKPPQPVRPWKEVRTCTGHPTAIQSDFYQEWDFDCTTLPMSEDCLYVDVWTPARRATDRLPVLVWVHGGAYECGASLLPKYDAVNLARRGAVVVSIEYRVGVLGFLADRWLSAESPHQVSGNYGVLDVFAALKWVKRNIAAFGGDPHKVTAFGQSAGGSIMCFLLTSPEAKGLVDRVIVESGTGDPNLPMTLADGEKQGDALAAKLGCTSLAQLRKVDPMKVQQAADELGWPDYRWEPVIDGRVLPYQVFTMFSKGMVNRVPTIISSTAQDSPLEVPEGMSLDTPADYEAWARTVWGDAAPQVTALFPVTSDMTPAQIQDAAWSAVTFYQTDTRARYYAGIIQGDSAKPRAFVCQWGRVVPGWVQLGWGAFHEIELSYVFDNVWLGYPEPELTPWDDHLSSAIQRYWVQFARTGDPNTKGLPHWPAYRGDPAGYLYFGDDSIATRPNDTAAYDLFLNLWRAQY